jgi:hypothetical protein
LRLKLNCDSIYQDEQIKEFNIPANEKFSRAEYASVRFVNGVLTTGIPIVQQFLESHPQFVEFDGISGEGLKKCFKVDDTPAKIKSANRGFKQKVSAGVIISKCNLSEAQSLLKLINGSASDVPNDIDEAQLELADLVERSDEALNKVLSYGDSGGFNDDDEVKLLIARLLEQKKLSFDVVTDFVCKRRDDTWIPVKQVSSDMAYDARVQIFADFLLSKNGVLLRDDLEEMVEVKEQEPDFSNTTTANDNDESVEFSGNVGVDEFKELETSGVGNSTDDAIKQNPSVSVDNKSGANRQTRGNNNKNKRR